MRDFIIYNVYELSNIPVYNLQLVIRKLFGARARSKNSSGFILSAVRATRCFKCSSSQYVSEIKMKLTAWKGEQTSLEKITTSFRSTYLVYNGVLNGVYIISLLFHMNVNDPYISVPIYLSGEKRSILLL